MTVENLTITVKTNADKAALKLDTLTRAIDKVQVSANGLSGGAITNLTALANAMNTIAGLSITTRAFTGLANGLSKLADAAILITSDVIYNLERVVNVLSKLQGVNLNGVGAALNGVSRAANKVGASTRTASAGIKEVGKAANKAQTPLGNFLASLKRIAYYRIIRGIIKSITQAFSEGLEKAYLFSSGIVGEGNRFAQAMDSIKSKGNQMKGQLGSAFIALLTAVEPVLITLINLVTKVADAISQLLAAFTGKTYLKANATAAQFADTMKSGGAAAKEWKNQLLGFDEINRLNEPSNGGGGGGASGVDPSQMFSDAMIEGWAMKIHDNLALIETVAAGFALAVGLILALSGVNIPLGIALIAAGAYGLAKSGTLDWSSVDTNVASVLHNIMVTVGLASLAIGAVLALSGANIPLGLGLIAVGAASLVTAAAIRWGLDGEVGEQLSKITRYVSLATFAIGLILALTGVALPLGLAMMGASIVGYGTTLDWDAMLKGIQKTWQKIKDFYNQHIKKYFTKEHWQTTINEAFNLSWPTDGIRQFAQDVSDFITSLFQPLADLCAWIDSALQGFSLLSGVNSSSYNVYADPSAWTSNFASGGFPTEGQLFVANESGPELVGTMGGHTAVANQGQIVEGIRQGVFDAVSAAMAQNNGDDRPIRVYLDSREIKAGQSRVNRAWGVG